MSLGRENRPLKLPRKSHTAKRHAEPPMEPRSPADPTIAPLGFDEWSKLGVELAALGPYRLTIATHAARAAASGAHLAFHDEEKIAAWFTGIVDEAIRRGGSSGDDSDLTAAAIWHVLHGDWHRDPERVYSPRCPVVAEVPCPGEPGFLALLRVAAAGYVHTTIAGASADDIAELCSLLTATDDGLEVYRPWGLVDAEDAPASELLEPALANLTLRRPSNTELCSGFGGWAQGFAQVAIEHTISPVDRIGAIAWLARVALRDQERAA